MQLVLILDDIPNVDPYKLDLSVHVTSLYCLISACDTLQPAGPLFFPTCLAGGFSRSDKRIDLLILVVLNYIIQMCYAIWLIC